jgi:hypothetical protein
VHVSGLVHMFPSQLASPSGLNWQVAVQHELPVPLSRPTSHCSPGLTRLFPQRFGVGVGVRVGIVVFVGVGVMVGVWVRVGRSVGVGVGVRVGCGVGVFVRVDVLVGVQYPFASIDSE